MNVTTNAIVAINRDFAQVPLSEHRLEPVRLELDQLAAAIEAVRARLTFDSEPANLIAVLMKTPAGGADRG